MFYFVFEGNFLVQAPGEAYSWRGDLTEGFLGYEFGGLIFGGTNTWRGLFSEFYGNFKGGPIHKPFWLPWAPLPHVFLKFYLYVLCVWQNDNKTIRHSLSQETLCTQPRLESEGFGYS